ncbi:MAG: hypothetical protein LBG21_03985 [Campylobacteraceae bacterium]|jgi:hypothetical protein|nr:hypothetical protein [Campylobacteraceae bacterium]
MKILFNFLTAVFGIVVLVGCGGSSSSNSDNSPSSKCTNPNIVLPSIQDVLTFFPQSLINEQHKFIDQSVSFDTIDDVEKYEQLLINAGFTLDTISNSSMLLYDGPSIDNKYFSRVYIHLDLENFVSWQLGISIINGVPTATEIDESIFDNTTIFPPTKTKKFEVEMSKSYDVDMSNKMNDYIQELKNAGFEYYKEDVEWNSYHKTSTDGCLLYVWANYNEPDRAEWRVWYLY